MRKTGQRLHGIFVLLFAIGMTWLFWSPLWNGGGLIGGDLYPYYFPQKAFLADSLKQGIIPLWNPLVGFGYPTLGESQTGVLYPPNLIFYSQFSLNTAYNLSQLLHYVIAFTATWALGRRLGLSTITALFAAVVFVYGWFPARICLEWAIVGGAWFAAILWAATVYLQTGKTWSLGCVSVFLGMDLLAGHYHLAFITLIVLAVLPFLLRTKEEPRKKPLRQLSILLIMIGLGFLIAAVQLIPSWELKSLSQRQEVNEVFAPTYGHLPPTAISQLWQPWSWHAGELSADQYLEQANWLSVSNATNQVEAYLYCGLLTLVLIVLGCCSSRIRNEMPLNGFWRWIALALFGLLMATGWPSHYFSWLPGIGFFRGPGRYSMITALAFALLSGSVLDAIFKRFELRQSRIWATGLVCMGILVADLWSVSRQYQFGAEPYIGRQVFYATMVDQPPIHFREQSQLRKYFADIADEVRLYAPGQNVPTLLGVSSIPVYLGLGPEIYESDQFQIDFSNEGESFINETREQLLQFGVTHLLLEEPIDPAAWDVTFIGPQFDELLNRALGRREPFYFYEINNALGRVSAMIPGDPVNVQLNIDASPNRIDFEVTSVDAFENVGIILRDLNYPGWNLHDDSQQLIYDDDRLFRYRFDEAKELRKSVLYEWIYDPWTVKLGRLMSLLGIVLTFVVPFNLSRFTEHSNLKT